MKLLLLLFPVLVAAQWGYSTPATPLDQCLSTTDIFCGTSSGSLVLVDASLYSLGGLMDKQYQFLLNDFLPRYNVYYKEVILSYGDGSSLIQNNLTNHVDACQVTQAKYDFGLEHGGQSVYLADTVQSIYNLYTGYYYTYMIFSATTNAADVINTPLPSPAQYQTIGVVDWSGQQMWRDRKISGEIDFLMEIYPDSDLNQMAVCLEFFSCNYAQDAQNCTGEFFSSPAPPTTVAQTTSAPTMAPSTPSVVNPLSQEPQCSCNNATVWVDVMLAFDSSINAAANRRQFLELVSQVTSEMSVLPIETSASKTQFHTRIGIISYGNEAQLVTYLGQQNDVDFENQEVPYTQDPKTNISDALRLAIDQFNSVNHRPNVRPVIVLVANTFTNGEASALAQATDFKNKSGIIVVYYFDPIVTQYNLNILQQLASPGYFIYNALDNNDDALVTAMCDANCFCPVSYVTPMVDPVRGYPIAGCHTGSVKKANQAIASNNCNYQNKGFLSTAKYMQKSQYLESLLGTGVKFWLGLTYDKFSESYNWSDGTPFNTSTTAWHPFAYNLTSSTQNCVFEANMAWNPTDGKPSYSYLCEAFPCSSTMYCDSDN